MSDRFDPRQIQIEHLKTIEFRTTLKELVQTALGLIGPGLLMSEENQRAKEEAHRSLVVLLNDYYTKIRFVLPPGLGRSHPLGTTNLGSHNYTSAANGFIVYYTLGPLLTESELQNDVCEFRY